MAALQSDYNSMAQKVYIAYFGRPADATGLLNMTAQLLATNVPVTGAAAADTLAFLNAYATNPTIKAIIDNFGNSNESVNLYGSGSPDVFITAIYMQLFGRAPTSEGLTFWGNALGTNAMTRGEAALRIVEGALSNTTVQGQKDAVGIVNKTIAASAFSAAMNTPSEIAGYVGTAAADSARTWLADVTDSFDTLATATAGKDSAVSAAVLSSTTTGKLADGYIRGATVFADANGDGVWNTGEAKATTDANGNFSLQGASGKLIASGGTDISTNLAFHGVFTAADGSGMINPLTTLVQAMVTAGATQAQAQTQVLAALGLPSTTNLQTLDAMAVALGSGTTAEKAAAAQVQAATAKVANILVQGAAIIQGTSGGTSAADASATMATALAANFSAATGAVDLTQTSVLQSVMTAAAADTSTAATTAVAASLTNIGSVMSGANTAINTAMTANPTDLTAALSQIAKVQVVAQGDAATSLTTGMAAGSITTTVTSFTGTGLTTAVTAADAGTLTPTVEGRRRWRRRGGRRWWLLRAVVVVGIRLRLRLLLR